MLLNRRLFSKVTKNKYDPVGCMCGETTSTQGSKSSAAKFHFAIISGVIGLLLLFGDPVSSTSP